MHALPRRTFLRSAGVALGLPLLDAMTPRLRATPPAPPRRFVGMMTNQGILPEFFFPTKAGRNYDSTPYLDILKPHRGDMTVFSGVSLPGVDGGHAAEAAFLTGAPGASRGTFRNSVSLDQVMAERAGGATRFPSLTLMVGADNLGLSWTRSGSMIPPTVSPLKLYQQLFADDTAGGKAAAARRLRDDRSLLDGLHAQYNALERSVGPADRDRLDQFATGVRDLERRLATAEHWLGRPKPKVATKQPDETADVHDLAFNAKVTLDLVRLALETDSVRVVTVCFNTTILTPTKLGVRTHCHGLTHHGQRPERIAELRLIEEAQFRALADFLAGLRAAPEPGGTLLDRTACLYGTNMGSANAHSNDNLPVLLAGGRFAHGRHLAFDRANNYPLSNLYVSLLQWIGVEANAFASGTGTLRGLEFAAER